MKGGVVGPVIHYATRAEAVAQFYTPGASANRRIEAVAEWHGNVAGYAVGRLLTAFSQTRIERSQLISFVEQTLCK